jgi:hypothetical protein
MRGIELFGIVINVHLCYLSVCVACNGRCAGLVFVSFVHLRGVQGENIYKEDPNNQFQAKSGNDTLLFFLEFP